MRSDRIAAGGLILLTVIAMGCQRPPERTVTSAEKAQSAGSNGVASQPVGPGARESTGPDGSNTSSAPVPALRVIGTEPFWGIDVDGSRLHFTTMEDQVGRRLVADDIETEAGRWQWRGGGFELVVQLEACSDGMSDRRYSYAARFTIDQMDYRGCADAPAKFSGEGKQP